MSIVENDFLDLLEFFKNSDVSNLKKYIDGEMKYNQDTKYFAESLILLCAIDPTETTLDPFQMLLVRNHIMNWLKYYAFPYIVDPIITRSANTQEFVLENKNDLFHYRNILDIYLKMNNIANRMETSTGLLKPNITNWPVDILPAVGNVLHLSNIFGGNAQAVFLELEGAVPGLKLNEVKFIINGDRGQYPNGWTKSKLLYSRTGQFYRLFLFDKTGNVNTTPTIVPLNATENDYLSIFLYLTRNIHSPFVFPSNLKGDEWVTKKASVDIKKYIQDQTHLRSNLFQRQHFLRNLFFNAVGIQSNYTQLALAHAGILHRNDINQIQTDYLKWTRYYHSYQGTAEEQHVVQGLVHDFSGPIRNMKEAACTFHKNRYSDVGDYRESASDDVEEPNEPYWNSGFVPVNNATTSALGKTNTVLVPQLTAASGRNSDTRGTLLWKCMEKKGAIYTFSVPWCSAVLALDTKATAANLKLFSDTVQFKEMEYCVREKKAKEVFLRHLIGETKIKRYSEIKIPCEVAIEFLSYMFQDRNASVTGTQVEVVDGCFPPQDISPLRTESDIRKLLNSKRHASRNYDTYNKALKEGALIICGGDHKDGHHFFVPLRLGNAATFKHVISTAPSIAGPPPSSFVIPATVPEAKDEYDGYIGVDASPKCISITVQSATTPPRFKTVCWAEPGSVLPMYTQLFQNAFRLEVRPIPQSKPETFRYICAYLSQYKTRYLVAIEGPLPTGINIDPKQKRFISDLREYVEQHTGIHLVKAEVRLVREKWHENTYNKTGYDIRLLKNLQRVLGQNNALAKRAVKLCNYLAYDFLAKQSGWPVFQLTNSFSTTDSSLADTVYEVCGHPISDIIDSLAVVHWLSGKHGTQPRRQPDPLKCTEF